MQGGTCTPPSTLSNNRPQRQSEKQVRIQTDMDGLDISWWTDDVARPRKLIGTKKQVLKFMATVFLHLSRERSLVSRHASTKVYHRQLLPTKQASAVHPE